MIDGCESGSLEGAYALDLEEEGSGLNLCFDLVESFLLVCLLEVFRDLFLRISVVVCENYDNFDRMKDEIK